MKLKLRYAGDMDNYNDLLFHASFQVLVDYVHDVKGQYIPNIDKINNWEYNTIQDTIDVPPPHPYEMAYANATWWSRLIYKSRWRKHLAVAFMHQELLALGGPDATSEESNYAHDLGILRDLYLWYVTEYKNLPTEDKESVCEEKLDQLMSVRKLLWE